MLAIGPPQLPPKKTVPVKPPPTFSPDPSNTPPPTKTTPSDPDPTSTTTSTTSTASPTWGTATFQSCAKEPEFQNRLFPMMRVTARLENMPNDRSQWENLCKSIVFDFEGDNTNAESCTISESVIGQFVVYLNGATYPASMSCYRPSLSEPITVCPIKTGLVARQIRTDICTRQEIYDAISRDYYELGTIADLLREIENTEQSPIRSESLYAEILDAKMPVRLEDRRNVYTEEDISKRDHLRYPFIHKGFAFHILEQEYEGDGTNGLQIENMLGYNSPIDHVTYNSGRNSALLSASTDYDLSVQYAIQWSLGKNENLHYRGEGNAGTIYLLWVDTSSTSLMDLTDYNVLRDYWNSYEAELRPRYEESDWNERKIPGIRADQRKMVAYSWRWSEILLKEDVPYSKVIARVQFDPVNATHSSVTLRRGPRYQI